MKENIRTQTVRVEANAGLTEHMDQPDPTLLGTAQQIRLSKSESAAMREALRSFVQSHPVRVSTPETTEEGEFWSKVQTYLLAFRPMPAFLLIVLFLVGAGGSLSYAAESSLPGDFLYPLKVNVNEEVQAEFKTTAHAKAQWNAARAERRIREAEQLIAVGELTDETRARLMERFAQHLTESHEAVSRLRETDSDAAATLQTEIESDLASHADMLDMFIESNDLRDDLRIDVRNFVQDVRAATQSDAQASGEAETQATVTVESPASLTTLVDGASDKILEVKTFVKKNGNRVSPQIKAQAESRLRDAEQKLQQANASMEAGAHSEAAASARSARNFAQEAKVMMQTAADLDLDTGL